MGYEKGIRSKSPPIAFGGLSGTTKKPSVLLDKKKIAIVDIISNCGDST